MCKNYSAWKMLPYSEKMVYYKKAILLFRCQSCQPSPVSIVINVKLLYKGELLFN